LKHDLYSKSEVLENQLPVTAKQEHILKLHKLDKAKLDLDLKSIKTDSFKKCLLRHYPLTSATAIPITMKQQQQMPFSPQLTCKQETLKVTSVTVNHYGHSYMQKRFQEIGENN
jgi:hypothetical protein